MSEDGVHAPDNVRKDKTVRRERATAIGIAALLKAGRKGRFRVDSDLYVEIDENDRRNWGFRYSLDSKPRWMRLGAVDVTGKSGGLTLAQAKHSAAEKRVLVPKGVDPIDQRWAEPATRKTTVEATTARVPSQTPTFEEACEDCFRDLEKGWRSAQYSRNWLTTARLYAYPAIGNLPVSDITTDHVEAVLQPLYEKKPATGKRLRRIMETVLDGARVRGWRAGENPARWRGHLAVLLPKLKTMQARHHAALDWRQMGAFMRYASEQRSMVWCCIEFVTLTAARSGEVPGMRWREVDWQARTWTVPAERMKAQREHRVPLSEPALELLRQVRGDVEPDGGSLLSRSPAHDGELTDASLLAALKRAGWKDAGGRPVTVHGLRSTFRDWCAEETDYPREVAEAALAHVVGDRVEAAYRRSDLFEKRRRLLADWAAFRCPPSVVNRQGV